MRDLEQSSTSFAGQILVASPSLGDPHFRRSVVLLSVHNAEDGALGVIINHPLDQNLEDLVHDFAGRPVGKLPVYAGGPVSPTDLLLAAWKWDAQTTSFRLYFGIEPEKLESLMEEDGDVFARAFLGYAGWSAGQLEHELSRDDWASGPLAAGLMGFDEASLWRAAIREKRPDWSLQAAAPDDPSVN